MGLLSIPGLVAVQRFGVARGLPKVRRRGQGHVEEDHLSATRAACSGRARGSLACLTGDMAGGYLV